MSQQHTVRSGECLASIAYRYGFFPETIWDHPDNAELKQARAHHSVLCAGDVVTIPDKQISETRCALDQTHTFRRKSVPETLQLQLMLGSEPRADEPYSLEVDGELVEAEGITDAQGRVEHGISPAAKVAVVSLLDTNERYVFALGHVDPIDTVSGVKARLKSLGFWLGSIDDQVDDAYVVAIATFQSTRELAATGEADDATRQALVDDYGI